MRFNKHFYQIFLTKESKTLAGKQYKNVLSLLGILLMTFMAIGFGEGGLDYLEVKMSDPFINWINVPLPSEKSDQSEAILSKLNNAELRKQYMFSNIMSYSHFYLYFYDQSGTPVQAEGRTIEASSPLLRRILSPEFLMDGISVEDIDNYFSNQSVGLIVCRDYLNTLGYKKPPAFLQMVYPINNEKDLSVPIPLVAVVKQLPGMVSMLSTPLFFKETNFPTDQPFNLTSDYHQHYLRYFVRNPEEVEQLKNKLSGILNQHWSGMVRSSFSDTYTQSLVRGSFVQLELNIDTAGKGILADHVDAYLRTNLKKEDITLERIYDYQFGRLNTEELGQDYLSVYFNSLDSISGFQHFLERECDLKIELSQIDAKENYNFISKLTLITSLFLIVFGIISVSMFLTNLIKSHFEKIKKNIGTFKAFGLNNQRLITTYTLISFTFVTAATALAFILAWGFGSIGTLKFLLGIFDIHLERGYLYFDLMTPKTAFTIVTVIGLSTLNVLLRLRKMLSNTPGDLIYERK